MTDPHYITLPPTLGALFAELCDRFARHHGNHPDSARRLVELAICQRGMAAVQAELDEAAPVAVKEAG